MPSALDFRVLGPVGVLRGGAEVPLGGLKRRALLGLLVAASGRVVPTASIIDALWDDEPPATALSSVQVSISALRSALRERGADGQRLVQTVAPGYRLALAAEQCDLARFRRGCADARRAESLGRIDAAASLYRRALGEWSGRAFEDLAGYRFADELAATLDEERLTALEARLRADLDLGGHHGVIAELGALVDAYPLRESLWRHLLLALYRCERQADALAAYRRLRTVLDDELGVEPSAPLRELEHQILVQDPALDVRAASVSPTVTERDDYGLPPALVRTPDGARHPVPPAGLRIGRDPGMDVVLDDARVSRAHAVVVPTAAGYALVDLGSTNGSRVDGDPVVGQYRLTDGAEIALGAARLRFVISWPTGGSP